MAACSDKLVNAGRGAEVVTERSRVFVAVSLAGKRAVGDSPAGLKGAATAFALSAKLEALLARSRRVKRRNDDNCI